MKPVRIQIRPIVIEFSPKRVIISARWPGSPHLTLFLDPQPSGRWAGLWRPHITFVGGRRIWLGAIASKTVERFSQKIGREFYDAWSSATTPIDLGDLASDDWLVFLPEEATITERLVRIFSVGDRTYRVNHERFERLGEEMLDAVQDEWLSPLVLAERDAHDQPCVAIRVTDDDVLEQCWVSRRHDPTDEFGEWQTTPEDWMPRERREEIFLRHLGDEFRDACSQIARALRLRDPFRHASR